MFAEERPTLRPSRRTFRYYCFGDRTVHLDGCSKSRAAFYGAPPGWIGRRVHVQWNALHSLARSDDPAAPREHLRAPGLSPHRRPRRPSVRRHHLALLGRAATAGAAIGAVCRAIHTRAPRTACAKSSACSPWPRNTAWPLSRTPQRRHWRLASRPIASCASTSTGRPPLPLTLKQVDPLIRQLTLYRDLIDQKQEALNDTCRTRSCAPQTPALGMADVLETRLRHAQAERLPPLDLIARSLPTSSADAKTVCWPAGTSSPASAIPTARSRISISTSTRR